MYIIFSIFAIIILFISLILFLKFSLIIGFVKNQGEKASFSILISFFGGKIKHTIKPLKKKKNAKKEEKDSKKSDNNENTIGKLNGKIETLKKIKTEYQNNKHFLKEKVIVKELDVYIKFGLSDAMQTGIATGVVWSLLYQVLALITCISVVDKHNFEVEPVFDKNGFCTSGKGIFSFRLINIISVAIRILHIYKKISKEEKN